MTARTDTDPAAPLLVARDLSVDFRMRGKATVRAVDRVSFEVAEGETFGLIGESGSGKSTVARAIVGLQAHAGTVVLDGSASGRGSRAARRARAARVQMVFQDPHSALDPRMRVGRSVRAPLDVHGRGRPAERDALALSMLDRTGLGTEHANRYPHQLSGGQKQRVNIARALVLEPQLLICDESVSALDLALQAEILNLLADLKTGFGLTLLLISHDLGVIAHLADRIAVMYLGRIVELAPTEDVLVRPQHPYTEALVSARLDPGSRRRQERIVLTGDAASPFAPPSGCGFRTRCRYARPRCAAEQPPLKPASGGGLVACHFADELSLAGAA